MLAEIYGWFTEGFDTAELKDAKALVDELDDKRRCCARSATARTQPMRRSALNGFDAGRINGPVMLPL